MGKGLNEQQAQAVQLVARASVLDAVRTLELDPADIHLEMVYRSAIAPAPVKLDITLIPTAAASVHDDVDSPDDTMVYLPGDDETSSSLTRRS
jgi:hypothetical protein